MDTLGYPLVARHGNDDNELIEHDTIEKMKQATMTLCYRNSKQEAGTLN